MQTRQNGSGPHLNYYKTYQLSMSTICLQYVCNFVNATAGPSRCRLCHPARMFHRLVALAGTLVLPLAGISLCSDQWPPFCAPFFHPGPVTRENMTGYAPSARYLRAPGFIFIILSRLVMVTDGAIQKGNASRQFPYNSMLPQCLRQTAATRGPDATRANRPNWAC